MNVAQLKARLENLVATGHGHMEVRLEGCDCYGPCAGVEVYAGGHVLDDGPAVLLRREES